MKKPRKQNAPAFTAYGPYVRQKDYFTAQSSFLTLTVVTRRECTQISFPLGSYITVSSLGPRLYKPNGESSDCVLLSVWNKKALLIRSVMVDTPFQIHAEPSDTCAAPKRYAASRKKGAQGSSRGECTD